MTRVLLIAMIGMLAGLADCARPAAAQDCPDARTAGDGFVVEIGNRARNEVLHDGSRVRTIFKIDGKVWLETTQFEGLFDLDRVDRGRQSTFKPKSNLAKLFPLKVGQRAAVEFEMTVAKAQPTKRTVVLHVSRADRFSIGNCSYKVFKIEHSESHGDAEPVFLEFDYYAPELKLVVAKEYKERNGRTSINRYDRIFPLAR